MRLSTEIKFVTHHKSWINRDVPQGEFNKGKAIQIYDCNGSVAQWFIIAPSVEIG